MNTVNRKIFNTRNARNSAISAIMVLAIALPGTSFAGGYWAENSGITKVRAKVQSVKTKATKKVKQVKGKATDKIEDMVEKLDDIYSQIEENRPLLNQIKDGPLMNAIGDTLQFLHENSDEFQQFVSQEGEYFRDDVKNLLSDFIAISQDFPVARQKGKVVDQMQKTLALIDKLPPVFLYPMYKAIGPKLEEMQHMITSLRSKLAALPELPPLMDLYIDPMAHAQAMCDFVTDKKVAVHVATIQAILKTGVWSVGVVLDNLPKDLTVNAMVVGGGGTTVAAHPARAPFNMIKMILEGADLGITQYSAIGKSVCTASGLYTPS